MTNNTRNNMETLYGPSLGTSWNLDEPQETSPLNTMPLPLKTNDPVRRKLHPWFEDFEFYKFKHVYIIYYTAAKDEIYVTAVDDSALQDLLRNVNLEILDRNKKARRYTRHPEMAWKIVAAYCLTYGEKHTRQDCSMMTIFLKKVSAKELQVIAPYWQQEAATRAEFLARREKTLLRNELDELRKDRDKWRALYVKEECKEEARLRLARQSRVQKSKKRA